MAGAEFVTVSLIIILLFLIYGRFIRPALPFASGVPAIVFVIVRDLLPETYDVKRKKIPAERFGPKVQFSANSAPARQEMCKRGNPKFQAPEKHQAPSARAAVA